jgi:hypothetical protein
VDDQSPCLFYQQPCDTPLLRLPLPVPLEVYCRTHFFRGVTGRRWHLQATYLVGACKAPRWCPSCQGGLWLGVAPGRRHSGPVRERIRSCNMGRVKTARPLHRTTISNFLAHSLSTHRQTPSTLLQPQHPEADTLLHCVQVQSTITIVAARLAVPPSAPPTKGHTELCCRHWQRSQGL